MRTKESLIAPISKWRFGPKMMDSEYFERVITASRHRFSLPIMLLRAAGKSHELRMKILEFIDVLPSLHSSRDVCEHFTMLIGPERHALPLFLRLGSYALSIPGARHIGTQMLRWLVYKKLAPHFIVADLEALASLKEPYIKDGARISVDFLGELVTSESEARYFFELYCSTIRRYSSKGGEPFQVSIKLSSLYPFFGPENYAESKRRTADSFAEILRLAQKHNAFVTVDAEQYSFRHLVEDVFCDVISRESFKGMTHVGIALQAYRKDALVSAARFVRVARERGAPFTIRLVKGAYWDTELAIAEQNNWPVPLFTKKRETDKNFERVFAFLICHWKIVFVSPATHNPESIAYVYGIMHGLDLLSDKHFMFQVLYGLGEPVRKALCGEHLPVLVYAPVGAIAQGMAYCARRILENTSNEGFLFQLLGGKE